MFSKTIYHNLCHSRKTLIEQWGSGSNLHRHHIIPKHSGGDDSEENFTYLTVREHIIAHYLLWRMNKNPQDLRSMKMLGAKLTTEQRKKTGIWCRDNGVGFHGASSEEKESWRKQGWQTQKKNANKGDKNFYYWSTPEGRKERSSMGGTKTCSDPSTPWGFWASLEGRKERASMGGKALKGMICVTNGKHRTRIQPEKLDQYISNGYVRGFTLSSDI